MKNLKQVYFKISLLLVIAFVIAGTTVSAQTLSDGPMELKIRLKDVQVGFGETDATVLGSNFAPDEIMFKVWVVDSSNLSGLTWQGGILHVFNMGTGGIAPLPGNTPDINDTLFDFAYTGQTVPQYYSLRMEAWEDDLPSDSLLGYCANGSDTLFDSLRCCGNPVFGACVGLAEGDDKHCNANIFAAELPYRNGPVRTWFNQGYISGTCGSNWKIGIETYWDSPNVSGIEPFSNNTADDEISIAPSPTFDDWQLFVGKNHIGDLLEIFDTNGNCVFKSVVQKLNSKIDVVVQRGIYLLQISSSQNVMIKKLVKM